MASRVWQWTAVVASAFGLALLEVARDETLGPVDVAWITLLLTGLAAVAQLLWRSVRRQRSDRARARELAARDPLEVAARAVVEERVRLAVDVEAVVRGAVLQMRTRAAAAARSWNLDPDPDLLGVQTEGQRAGTELRRLLGLLREDVVPPPAVPPADRHKERVAVPRADLGLAAGAVALAALERHVYGDLATVGPPGAETVTSLALTLLTAATVALRRAAPGAGAAVAAGSLLLAATLGTPVSGGVWLVVALGTLAWAAASRGGRSTAAAGLLLGATVGAMAWRWPDNLMIVAIVLGVPTACGLLAAWSDQRASASRQSASRRAAELAAAADDAVRRERLAVARDLHDVVSHAVGVMIVQAAAASALRHVDEGRARAALDVVHHTAGETLDELDRIVEVIGGGALGDLPRTSGQPRRTIKDVHQLVARMRAAGLPVDLQVHLAGALDGEVGAAAYRIVQEALTNVLRHAFGATVQVRVRHDADGVLVEVVDDGPGRPGELRRGYGLVGIAERVQRLGGVLYTGPGEASRGFRVTARIPAEAGLAGVAEAGGSALRTPSRAR